MHHMTCATRDVCGRQACYSGNLREKVPVCRCRVHYRQLVFGASDLHMLMCSDTYVSRWVRTHRQRASSALSCVTASVRELVVHIITTALHLSQHLVMQSCIVCPGDCMSAAETGPLGEQQPHASTYIRGNADNWFSGTRAEAAFQTGAAASSRTMGPAGGCMAEASSQRGARRNLHEPSHAVRAVVD